MSIFVILLIGSYISICIFLYIRQGHYIFFPDRQIRATPALYHLPYQDIYISVGKPIGEKEKINGWWIPSDRKGAKTLLYLHGNSANMGKEVERVRLFHQLGLSIFLIDYRGFGKSGGDFPSEAQVYEDAEAAWQYLIQKNKARPREVFIYGHSLGGAIAIELALHHPETPGLIIESSFTRARDLAVKNWWTHYIPLDLLFNQQFDSMSKVKSLRMPILFIHGTADTVIPYPMSQQLFATATSQKKLLLIPEGDHDHNFKIGGSRYLETVRDFLKSNQRSTRPGAYRKESESLNLLQASHIRP
ncbi:MAG: alpha/beta fold hydrolase [Gloeobacterales cyanobacterium]